MTRYLIETYDCSLEPLAFRETVRRAARAAAAMRREGTNVRHVRSYHVPEDDTCFHVFDAPSIEAARLLAERAAIVAERVVEAFDGRGT